MKRVGFLITLFMSFNVNAGGSWGGGSGHHGGYQQCSVACPAGPRGPRGKRGKRGKTGPVGPVGPAGADGTNGIDGIDGSDGADGTDGTDGINGTNGIDGINGVSCWDSNQNGNQDASEDINGDGIVSVADCQGTQGQQGPPGPATNSCTAVLTQMGFDQSLVKDETFNGTAQASHVVNSCPAPYIRTGATCLASVTSGSALRQSGLDTSNFGVLSCRGLIGQADSNVLRLRSYPICTKVDLVCD